MTPHKIKAYLMGFTLGCILVGGLVSFRMINAEEKDQNKFTFKPIPPEKLLSSQDPIHPSLAIMANTQDAEKHILILEDIFPNEYIRVEESISKDNKLLKRKVLMADRLNLKLKLHYSQKDLIPILADIQAELLESVTPQENLYPIKLRSHSPFSLEKATEKLSHYRNIIASIEQIEFQRPTYF